MVAPGQTPLEDALVGQRLGDYVVEGLVAGGGMGLVYRAVQPLIGRQVAIKVLRPEWAQVPEQAERFLKEAQALSAIKHKGIIDIISFGHLPDGRQYMVMEYLEGESLEAVMAREAPMPAARALALLDDMLDALSAAHRAGVVHRDLKPSNVFLSRQSNGTQVVKLLDFGLAKQTQIGVTDTQPFAKASLMAGTPEYISPEQVQGLAPTARTDLYSLGITAFEMMTGRLPFKGDTMAETMKAQAQQPPPPMKSIESTVPDVVESWVAQLLAKAPDSRPPSADVARAQLLRIAKRLREELTHPGGGRPAQGAPTQKVVASPAWPQLAVVLVLSAAAVAALAWWWGHPRETKAVPVAVAPSPPAPKRIPDEAEFAPVPAKAVGTPLTLPEAALNVAESASLTAPAPPKNLAVPEVCFTDDWQGAVNRDLGKLEQAYRKKSSMTEGDVGRLAQLYERAKAANTPAECAEIMWQMGWYAKRWPH